MTTTIHSPPLPKRTNGTGDPEPRKSWVPAGLIALSFVPAIAGTARLLQLGSDAEVTDANRRFFDAPSPVIAHILAAIVFSLAGAVQFAPRLRRRHHRWHRVNGYFVVPAGYVAAATGIWMTHSYDLPTADNALLGAFRYLFGVAMLASLSAAVVFLRNRRFRSHGAWMARAYALGLGAGTQVFTHVLWLVASGDPTPTERAWLMFAGWAINVAVAEIALRRRASIRGRCAGLAGVGRETAIGGLRR